MKVILVRRKNKKIAELKEQGLISDEKHNKLTHRTLDNAYQIAQVDMPQSGTPLLNRLRSAVGRLLPDGVSLIKSRAGRLQSTPSSHSLDVKRNTNSLHDSNSFYSCRFFVVYIILPNVC